MPPAVSPAQPAASSGASPMLTRRAGLALALAVPLGALAACGSDDSSAASTTDGPTEGDGTPADEQAAQEADLVAQYDAVLVAFGAADEGVTALLADLRDQHARHRDALGGTATPSATVPTVPATLDAALVALATTERAASRARIRACIDATDGDRARLLSIIAASEAAHVPALRSARSAGTG